MGPALPVDKLRLLTARHIATQKMLIQQLRDLERGGIVAREVFAQVPPRVEYSLTPWGQAMCPALDALLEWGAQRPSSSDRD